MRQHGVPRWLRDRLARYVISFGGLAVILSILAIFVFLVLEVAPLFQHASSKQVTRLVLPSPAESDVIHIGLDEHQEVAYLLHGTGIQFVELQTGHPISVELPPALRDKRITAIASGGTNSPRLAVGTADGLIIPIKVGIATDYSERGERGKRPFLSAASAIRVGNHPVTLLAYRFGDSGSAFVARVEQGRLVFVHFREDHAEGADPVDPVEMDLPAIPHEISVLALDAPLLNLFVGTTAGWLFHIGLTNPEHPIVMGPYQTGEVLSPVTKLGLLNGDRSLVVMRADGAVSTWGLARDPESDGRWHLRRTHAFFSHSAAVTAFSPSQRDKGFLTGDTQGNVALHYATAGQTLLRLSGESAIRSVALAPKADGALTYDASGTLTLYRLQNPHPEVTLRALFGKMFYEGYDAPSYVWQSSSGSDEFEAKLSLIPLAFGTFKGTIYALLLAVPIAILAAVFTSQVMHPDLRAAIKPMIEVMAALPTVVLGFLAGLWLAPLLDRLFPALVGMLVVLPLLVVAASLVWQSLPRSFCRRFRPGTEALLLIPLLIAGIVACLWANYLLEQALFQGDFKRWLSDYLGVRYDQRNAIVVGIVMGFAIIPIIYSISEEALSNVPRNLVAGSLALGATRWQTVLHLVLLAASPGILSAVMIGFGRAIGETMIVLMATGNTPILDWSWANGFRTLSATIAVEIPEAPHGGTLYRVLFVAALLLFIVTFVVNTAAEVIRQRLREKYSLR